MVSISAATVILRDESVANGERMQSTLHVPHSRLVRAKPLRAGSAPRDEIEDALGTALDAARELARFYESLVHLEHAAELGDESPRRVKLGAARDLLAEMGATVRTENLTELLGSDPSAH
jgi:hypothetical protein